MDLLSVIIPVYQVEEYLDTCITSVLVQTYSELEIILVDDGATDNCPQICDSYAQKDSRVKVIHQANQGLSAARNIGISIANGQYVAFIDSDDYISPTFFEAAMEIFNRNHQIDIVELPMISRFNTKEAVRLAPSATAIVYGFDRVFPEWFHRRGYLKAYSQLKVYRKKLFNTLQFPVGKTFEDLHLTPQLLLKCQAIAFVEHETASYYYRWRSMSITCQAKWTDFDSQTLALQNIATIAERFDGITEKDWGYFVISSLNILIDNTRAAKKENIHIEREAYNTLYYILNKHKPSMRLAFTHNLGWHDRLKTLLLSLFNIQTYLRFFT